MKIAVILVVIGIALLGFYLYPAIVHLGSTTVDIHLNDTYFVIDNSHFVIAVALFLLTLFGFGGIMGTGVKNRMFLLIFFIALVLDGIVAWLVYHQFYGV